MTHTTTEYAEHVRDGKILASRAVRLACVRHLGDLERVGWDASFPYYFDEDEANKWIDFFPTFLTLEEGDVFWLDGGADVVGWQKFVIGSIFGWQHDTDEVRRFRHAYIETGKGSGKTPLLAGIGLGGLVIDGHQASEIYSAATQREQASIMLRDAIRMASASEELRDVITIGKHNLAVDETNSFFRSVSSEHKGLDGKRPHFALIDELHEHPDAMVVDKMRAGFKKDPEPLEVDITNSGHDLTSVCWEHHQRSIDVLEGVVKDEAWFAYVCHLDPCDPCYDKGYRQPREGCSDCDDWTDEETWPKSNPSLLLNITIDHEYLRKQVELALAIPSKAALIKRLNFCIWTQTHRIWIAPDDWNACKVDAVSTANEDRNAAALGLDLSAKLDLTAAVVAMRHEDTSGRDAEKVEIESTDEEGAPIVHKLTLNYEVELIPFFWLPEETLIERVKTERIPYDSWRQRGFLSATPGGVIDYDLIYQTIVGDLKKRFRLQALGYDPREATQLAVQLRDRGRVNVVELRQGRALSEAFKLIEVLIRSRRLRHDGNEVLAWCFANAEPKYDKYENLWIEKPQGTKRIDGAVASGMAVHQLMLLPHRRKGRRIRASLVTSGGVRNLREVPKRDRHSGNATKDDKKNT